MNVNGLTGGGTVTDSAAGPVVFTVGNADASSEFTGVIGNGSGTVSLAKAGSGMLTLQGNNTYTGATSINGGTLTLDSALDGTSYHAYTYVGGNISINNGSTLYVKASKYEFDGKTITFDSNGGGTIYVGGSSIGGSFLVNHSQITIATGGGSQDYIAGTQNINADGSTVTLNVVRGSDPSSDLTISGHFSGGTAPAATSSRPGTASAR